MARKTFGRLVPKKLSFGKPGPRAIINHPAPQSTRPIGRLLHSHKSAGICASCSAKGGCGISPANVLAAMKKNTGKKHTSSHASPEDHAARLGKW